MIIIIAHKLLGQGKNKGKRKIPGTVILCIAFPAHDIFDLCYQETKLQAKDHLIPTNVYSECSLLIKVQQFKAVIFKKLAMEDTVVSKAFSSICKDNDLSTANLL